MRISGVTYVPRKAHMFRVIFKAILLLIFILALIITLISAYMGWNIVHPVKTTIEPFSSNIVPDYKSVNFTSGDKNILLNGWFFKKSGSDKTIILAHDYGKSRLQFGEKTLEMIKGLLNKNYNVLAFDFRNSGKSSGTVTSLGVYEKDDVLGAVDYIKSTGSKHIALIGFSTGASACILAAAESKDIDAVIADSPFLEFRDYIKADLTEQKLLPYLFYYTIPLSVEVFAHIDIDNTSPRKAVMGISPRPILFIHGKNDDMIPITDSKKLYELYTRTNGNKAEFWEVENAGHVGAFNNSPEKYINKVLEFLDNVYAPAQ